MMKVERISVIKSAGTYMYFDAVVNVTEVTSNGRYRGTCTLPSGKEFSFSNSASGLQARIANDGINPSGKKVVIPCGHADHSTCYGEHKTVAVSAARREKKHRSVMAALNVLNDFLGYQDSLSMQVNAAWYEFKAEQERIEAEAEAARMKREAERKEAEAKKQAEAEAKKKKQLAEQILSEYTTLCKFMPEVQAASVIATTYGSDVVNSVLGENRVK